MTEDSTQPLSEIDEGRHDRGSTEGSGDRALSTLLGIARRTSSRAARLETMVENTQAGLALLDPDFNLLFVNCTCARMSGRDKGELIGLNLFDLFPSPEYESAFRLSRDTGRPIQVEEKPLLLGGQQQKGTTYCDWMLTPIRNQQGRVELLVLSVVDVSERVKARQRLLEFVRMVSHDLRSPLTAVLGQAQLVQRAPDQVDLVLRSARAIVAAARRLNAAIEDLVDIARAETTGLSLNRVAVDLPRYMSNLKEQLAAELECDRIRIEVPPSLPLVSADPRRLERIATNLLHNAFLYARPGTEITVSFSREKSEVVTTIASMGAGIPPQELQHLFERSHWAAAGRRKEGLGLDLYVARTLVEAHGGRIWAQGKMGKQSSLSFALPVASDE